jgi:glucokinase
LVLDFLLVRPQATAGRIADHLDLPISTAVSALSRLQEKGLVARGVSGASTGHAHNQGRSRGRPTLPYRVQLPGSVAAIIFDGLQIAGAIFDADGQQFAERTTDMAPVSGRDQAVDFVGQLLATLLTQAELPRDQLTYLAISLNAVRTNHGTLCSSVLPWANDDLTGYLQQKLSLPVYIITDSTLVSEFQQVADPTPESMLNFSIGDGVSCHAMLFGQSFSGHNSLSGELGHITVDTQGPKCGCGKRGCLEAYCNGPAICQMLLNGLDDHENSSLDHHCLMNASARTAMDHVWQAWNQNDHYTRLAMTPILDRIAWGLSLAVNLIDPDLVRISGYVMQGRQAWIDYVSKRVRSDLIHGERRELVIESGHTCVIDQLRVIARNAMSEYRHEGIPS